MDSVGATERDAFADQDSEASTSSVRDAREWILIHGDRLALTAAGSLVVLALFLSLQWYGVIAFTNGNSITRMASGMIAGTFSLVTLVVSVNQLILSQEFAPAGKYSDRLDGVMSFRRDIEETTDVATAPAEVSEMLRVLVLAIQNQTDSVIESAGSMDGESRNEVEQFARAVTENSDRVERFQEARDGDVFEVLAAAISLDSASYLHDARYFRNEVADSEEQTVVFDDLIEILKLFETGRHYLKTVYLQRELTRFSQVTIYAGFPAIMAAILIIPLYGEIGGMTVAAAYSPYAVIVLSTIVLIPVVLLVSYIIRITTLICRTAAIGPMTFEN